MTLGVDPTAAGQPGVPSYGVIVRAGEAVS
jgi:hypothetical protein